MNTKVVVEAKVISFALYFLLPVISLFLMGVSVSIQSEKTIKDIDIRFRSNGNDLFVDIDEVKKTIGFNEKLIGTPIGRISLQSIEQVLKLNHFVENAEAWVNAKGVLSIEIKLRTPIARVYNNVGESFYLDENGTIMPTSHSFTARTILVRGAIHQRPFAQNSVTDSTLLSLIPVLKLLHENRLLQAMFSELYINKHQFITLYPSLGNMVVELGPPLQTEQKFKDLLLFVEKVIPQTGWNYYQSINLAFQNQIVARRNHF
ncbi:MAG: hypothetical protein NZ108_05355 [Bacteroidia bacterium]|nr:hypothetical protein [Bacteroidia bacterium]